jgi:hypothetical protein
MRAVAKQIIEADPTLVSLEKIDEWYTSPFNLVQAHALRLRDFPQVIDMFAGWIGLTPDDAPLLMRDRSLQEIYALDLRFP